MDTPVKIPLSSVFGLKPSIWSEVPPVPVVEAARVPGAALLVAGGGSGRCQAVVAVAGRQTGREGERPVVMVEPRVQMSAARAPPP